LPATMPSNRARTDEDLVESTQYNVRPNQTAKKTPPQALAIAQIQISPY
jgi:hypothetical protein